MNQGDLEEELPLPLNLLMLPSFNVTESGIINAPSPVLQVTTCNDPVNSLDTPSTQTTNKYFL